MMDSEDDGGLGLSYIPSKKRVAKVALGSNEAVRKKTIYEKERDEKIALALHQQQMAEKEKCDETTLGSSPVHEAQAPAGSSSSVPAHTTSSSEYSKLENARYQTFRQNQKKIRNALVEVHPTTMQPLTLAINRPGEDGGQDRRAGEVPNRYARRYQQQHRYTGNASIATASYRGGGRRYGDAPPRGRVPGGGSHKTLRHKPGPPGSFHSKRSREDE